jgi:hypothetical protein
LRRVLTIRLFDLKPALRKRPKKARAKSGCRARQQQSSRMLYVWTVGDPTGGPWSRDMRLKRAMVIPRPSLQAAGPVARVRAARKPLRARSGTGVACSSNSSNRTCASSGLNVPERTRSVAVARATPGARSEGGEVEVEEERRRKTAVGAVE